MSRVANYIDNDPIEKHDMYSSSVKLPAGYIPTGREKFIFFIHKSQNIFYKI